jgi:hypothetical protein
MQFVESYMSLLTVFAGYKPLRFILEAKILTLHHFFVKNELFYRPKGLKSFYNFNKTKVWVMINAKL